MDWPILQGLPQDDVRRLIQHSVRRDWRAGDVLFQRGDPATALHLVRAGRYGVQASGRRSVTLAVLGPGDMFGEVALVDDQAPRSATVSALEDGSTLAIAKVDFDGLRARHPSVDRVVIAILTAQVRRLTDQMLEAAEVTTHQRVRRRLCSLADTYRDGDRPPVIRLPQVVIGQLADASRQEVSKVLRSEEAAGTLRRTGQQKHIEILDLDTLTERAAPPDSPPSTP